MDNFNSGILISIRVFLNEFKSFIAFIESGIVIMDPLGKTIIFF